jgi:hypothetical protein
MATQTGTAAPIEKPDAEEAGEFIPLGGGRAPALEQPGPAESANIASQFSEEEQKKIVATVCDDYDGDVKSRAGRMRKHKEYIGLHASVMKAKTAPFQGCANVNLPILTYPVLQVQGRLYDMVWPSSGKILFSSPSSMEDMLRAEVTELFANSYIRHKMPEMPQGLDDTLFQMAIFGSAFRRTYWNDFEKRICSDWIPVEDFVVSHWERSQDPSMRDVPRYTMVQHFTYYDIKRWGARGIYVNTDQIAPVDPIEKKDTELSQQLNKIDGSEKSNETTTEDKARMVLEQHRDWVLPDKGAYPFDGQPHAVIITVDNESQKLLRMVVREEPDPDDLFRFRRQQQLYDGHMQSLQAFTEGVQAIQSAQQVAAQQGITLPPEVLTPPTPPDAPAGLPVDSMGLPLPVEPQRMRKICFFTHYRAFPSEGFYGLGLGDFLAHLNKACNTLTNQHIDGVSFRNSKPFFFTRNMRSERGQINLAPGQGIEVDSPMGALKDGLYFPDVPGNDPTTMPLIKMLMEAADRLVASSDMMSGQTSGANRTAKEAQILAEQMMMQITVLARRVKEAFRHELLKIWRCFGVFLPDQEIVDVIGEGVDPRRVQIGRAMFTPDSHVTPAADPRTKTERIQEAQAIYGFIRQNEYLMAGPTRDQLMRSATEEVLTALGAVRFLKLLPQPPQPPAPPSPAQPWEEDADALQNKPHPVLPGDDDHGHLFGPGGHEAFKASPGYKNMSKEQKAQHDQHIRDHHAQLIRKSAQRSGMSGPPQPQQGPPQMQQAPGGIQ